MENQNYWMRLIVGCILLELVLPLSPLLIEFGLKSIFTGLGPFDLYQKTLATSSMILPFLLAIKSKNGSPQAIWFMVLMVIGSILFAVSIVYNSPKMMSPKDAEICYFWAGIALAVTMIFRFGEEFVRFVRCARGAASI